MSALTRRATLAGIGAMLVARPSHAAAVRDAIASHAAETGANLVYLRHGEQVAAAGDLARKLPAYSVRKSLLSALYGWAVAAGRIRLDATLADLGIDDVPPALSDAEKRATVRDLLSARSGIYHPAAYETRDMSRRRPARGSHPPGTHWYYNNWDFNALGTIYAQATGEDVFASFEQRIARPLGLEDLARADCAYVREPVSRHPAYTFRLTVRDLARFGELMRLGGSWQGRQLVPADWIATSTRAYSQTDRGDLGYGFMWWVIPPRLAGGGFLANGNNGQLCALLPRAGVVIAQMRRRDNVEGQTRRFLRLLREVVV